MTEAVKPVRALPLEPLFKPLMFNGGVFEEAAKKRNLPEEIHRRHNSAKSARNTLTVSPAPLLPSQKTLRQPDIGATKAA